MAARPVVIGRKRKNRHRRAEIGAADADIDHIGNRAALPREPSGTQIMGEGHHPGVRLAHRRHHICPVDQHRAIEIAQRRMQDRASLGLVDLRAREHRLALGRNASVLGQRDQQITGCLVDIGFGVVKKQPFSLGAESLRAGSGVKELQQRASPHRLGLRRQLVPDRHQSAQ